MTPGGLADPARISEQQWPQGTAPVVSIICTAFNHENYLRAAIDGFLMQKTSFPVEILINDDASTDSTAQILQEYASRYPDLIRATIQEENQYSRGNRPLPFLARMARGKYVAICEGDDYWISDAKLQTQVDMLEARPDASACIHRADGLLEQINTMVPGMYGPSDVRPEYDVDDLISGENFVPTASIVTKREIVADLPGWVREIPHSDIVILSTAALQGPILYVDQSMSVYRKHRGGIHSGTLYATQILNCLRTLVVMSENLKLTGRASFRTGFNFRMSQLATEVSQYEDILSKRDERHRADRETIKEIMSSRTFRLGLVLSKLRDRVRDRLQPSHRAEPTVTDARR